MDITEEVINFAKKKGADLVGVAPVTYFDKEPENRRPQYFVPHARSVISIALKVNDAILDFGLSSNGDLYTPRHDIYTQTLEGYLKYYNYNLLDYIAIETAKYLENLGHNSFPIQARVTDWLEVKGAFPHKMAAAGAGLGTIGKCSLVITTKYGPRVRFASIITEAELNSTGANQETTHSICGKCTKCIDICPKKIISYNESAKTASVDKMICWKLTLPGRCGLCMSICPYGRKVQV